MSQSYRGLDEFENMRGIKYQCVRCHTIFDGDKIADRNELKCPECSFKVIRKIKPPIAKRLKAV